MCLANEELVGRVEHDSSTTAGNDLRQHDLQGISSAIDVRSDDEIQFLLTDVEDGVAAVNTRIAE